ncbi:hypothetical protein [Actinokineospora iranica]|uniref:DUF5709 domain-containing protein n=1 Tax=Actinokineospora iranica TaxID=1271860 RepID=A0A1G6RVP0_9PSEU|nr:hypothetical protein [Actinokineospora iranica]SDD08503.1 hypothetical protein SAMN05216174_10746 [Actinokineospora iranica]
MSTDGFSTDGESKFESLDEDNLGLDPLEEGIEPPERWAEADKHGMTIAEQREGADIGDRLAAEEPDVSDPGRPGQDTPIDELSDRMDEPADDVDDVAPDEPERRSDTERRGRAADEAGGSVASALREE